MNKLTKRILLIYAIVVIVCSATLFLLVDEKPPQFWVSYATALLGLTAVAYGSWRNLNHLDQPSTHPFLSLSLCYLGGVFVVILVGYILWRFSLILYTICHLLLLAAYLVVMVVASSAHNYVSGQDKETRRQVIKARMDTERVVQLGEAADDLPEEIRGEAKRILHEVEEKLRYSDPMQSEETAEQAHDVETALDALEEAVDALQVGQADLTVLQQKAKVAIRKIDAYNRAKKILK